MVVHRNTYILCTPYIGNLAFCMLLFTYNLHNLQLMKPDEFLHIFFLFCMVIVIMSFVIVVLVITYNINKNLELFDT